MLSLSGYIAYCTAAGTNDCGYGYGYGYAPGRAAGSSDERTTNAAGNEIQPYDCGSASNPCAPEPAFADLAFVKGLPHRVVHARKTKGGDYVEALSECVQPATERVAPCPGCTLPPRCQSWLRLTRLHSDP